MDPWAKETFNEMWGGGGGRERELNPIFPKSSPPYSTILVKQAVLNQDT